MTSPADDIATQERAALDLLDEAYGEPSDARRAFVLARTEGDPGLRTRVLSLLGTEEEAGLRTGAGLEAAAPDEAPPERVGPWRVTELIGRGGMGAVYEGVRDDGAFDQRVAIKLVRRRGQRLSAPLREETRLLARLSHPHIAQVLDGGETGTGAPYLVMEHVDGVPLHQALEGADLPLPARLDLFERVLDAVAYAHRNGVVHRDLSPGNVLVREDGVVKVIDFGIARSLEEEGEASTARTEGFTAPERVAGEAGTTLSDIYSLGRLLERLTAGAAAPHARDLAAIIARATNGDPGARYASVEALRDDLARYRRGAAVTARGGAFYRARRLLTRYPLASLASAAALLALVGGLIVSTAALTDARRAEAEATERFDALRGLAWTVMTDVYRSLDGVPGTEAAQRKVVGIGHDYLRQLEADPRAEGELALDVAHGYVTMARFVGDTNTDLYFEPEEAERLRAEAQTRLASLIEARPDDPDVLLAQARALRTRGWQEFARQADLDAAQATMTKALTAAETAQAARPEDGVIHHLRLSILSDLAQVYRRSGETERSEEALRRIAAEVEEFAPYFESSGGLETAAHAKRNLAVTLSSAERYEEAEALLTESLADLDAAAAMPEARRAYILRSRGIALWRRAYIRLLQERYEDALADYEEAIGIAKARLAFDPNDKDAAFTVMLYGGEAALPLAHLGRRAEAEAAFAPYEAHYQGRFDAAPEDASARRAVMVLRQQAFTIYDTLGDEARACAELRKAAPVLDAMKAADQIEAYDAAYAEAIESGLAACSA